MILTACGHLSLTSENGTWFRAIQPHYWPLALGTAHTKLMATRFNEGASASPQFEILYLAEDALVALFEVEVLLGSPLPGQTVPHPRKTYIVLNVTVNLQHVADLTEISAQSALATTAQELTGDWRGYRQRSLGTSIPHPTGIAPTQELGAALFAVPRLEAFRTISAKTPYSKVLVVFPQKLRVGNFVRFDYPATGQTHVINGALP